jgi:co-chaperonin GroES (HSP10)
MEVPFTPTWKEHEKDITSNDPKKAGQAADAFYITRKKELRDSKRARDWESGRKKAIASNKPTWVKEQEGREKIESDNIVSKIKNFGTIDSDIRPYKGFILIKIINNDVQRLPSGIYMPDTNKEDNVAEVVAVGGPINLSSTVTVEAGVLPKDRVLIKKFAGIDVETRQGKCKLIQFSDILGVLE